MHTFPAITASVCNLRPTSRGAVHAVSPDPFAAPRIDPNYLSTEEDGRIAVAALRLTRKIMAAAPFAPHAPEEFLPGPGCQSDADLLAAARDIGTTIFHPTGTVKMGLSSDPAAVVDPRLRVFGIAGLRVADASIMPFITSGNTNSPTMMIADKAAKMVLEDA